MKKQLIFTLLILSAYSFNAAAEDDAFTRSCLIGYDMDVNPYICMQFDPKLGEEAAKAHKEWLARNDAALKKLSEACEERIQRAYKNDEAKIKEAKAKAAQYRAGAEERALANLRADPKHQTYVYNNCRYYVKVITIGPKSTLPDSFIEEIKNSPAEPVIWTN